MRTTQKLLEYIVKWLKLLPDLHPVCIKVVCDFRYVMFDYTGVKGRTVVFNYVINSDRASKSLFILVVQSLLNKEQLMVKSFILLMLFTTYLFFNSVFNQLNFLIVLYDRRTKYIYVRKFIK